MMTNARTTFFDRALTDALSDVEQVVILGAGHDTRAYRLPAGVRAFEVGDGPTLQRKRALLTAGGVDTSGVTSVAVDCHHESWADRLEAEGFDWALPTLAIWEGGTFGLDPDAVRITLRTLAGLAPGSRVVFDYPTSDDARQDYLRKGPSSRPNPIGGSRRFQLPFSGDARKHAARFVESEWLSLAAWAPFGPSGRPDGGLVVATIAPTAANC